MTMRRRIGLVLAAALVAAMPRAQAAQVASQKEDFPTIKAKAVADMGTAEGTAYMKSVGHDVEAVINSAHTKCRSQLPAEQRPSLELIVRIGKDGTPQEALARPDDAYTTCFAQGFAGAKFAVPPKVPFHMYIDLRPPK
jgi:hypothetical protein